jgi:hypothetical protein
MSWRVRQTRMFLWISVRAWAILLRAKLLDQRLVPNKLAAINLVEQDRLHSGAKPPAQLAHFSVSPGDLPPAYR